ncbi:MAG: hypothetical protein JOZ19_02720 [Rubrobacter sp.]|nr:hypothetical protein [Rubrobacter sp.]
MRSSLTPDEVFVLWYQLGNLYKRAGNDARRAFEWGFAVVCVSAALVLVSAPLFGTSWAGPLAPVLPVVAGLLTAGSSFGWQRATFLKKRNALRLTLAKAGEDADRPTAGGLGKYHDAQLILLRSQYEYLTSSSNRRALRSARLFEEAFGFTPEDRFECGPLNVRPGTQEMRILRKRWERRLAARSTFGEATPPLGLGEDLAYSVFPQEMTVPSELATRSAYLKVSCDLSRKRYGRSLRGVPEEIRHRAEKDLREYRALLGK